LALTACSNVGKCYSLVKLLMSEDLKSERIDRTTNFGLLTREVAMPEGEKMFCESHRGHLSSGGTTDELRRRSTHFNLAAGSSSTESTLSTRKKNLKNGHMSGRKERGP